MIGYFVLVTPLWRSVIMRNYMVLRVPDLMKLTILADFLCLIRKCSFKAFCYKLNTSEQFRNSTVCDVSFGAGYFVLVTPI